MIILIIVICILANKKPTIIGGAATPKKKRNRSGDRAIIGKLLSYTKGNVKYFVFAFIAMLVAVGMDLIIPVMIGRIFDLLAIENTQMIQIIKLIGLLLVIVLTYIVIVYFQSMSLQKAGQRIIYKIREDAFTKIENLAIAQINQIPVGKLVTRVTSDTDAINEMYTNIIINLIKNVLMIVGVVIAMFIIDVELTIYVLLITPFIVIFSIIFGKFSRRAHRGVRKGISNVNASLSENISGIKITQTFNQQEKQYNSFLEKNNQLKKSSFKQMFVFGIFRPSIYALYILTIVLLFYLVGKRMIDTNFAFKLSIVVVFYQYIEKFYTPIQQLADQFNSLQSSLAASERIFELLDTEPTLLNDIDAIQLDSLKGEIEFKNVWFAYENEDWILKDVSFKVNARETVAFVGATGSGKTTILSLIVRNYDIQKGQILIDGIDVKRIDVASLRRCIGQMLQDVFLFSGTIASNIALREENITETEINEACKFVNADKVIDKLPKGLDEEVRERGNNFSAGERQLLSFARVIAHKPNIMILDEATANIDTETEVLIQDSLKKMMNIGTMLIVAHRLSTIQHADNIIVLKNGRIIEQGNHRELLKQGGYYYQLYALQYSHQEK